MSKTKPVVSATADLFTATEPYARQQEQSLSQTENMPIRDRPALAKVRAAAKSKRKQSSYYLPIAQVRGQVFLAHGLIYPTAYDSNAAPSIGDVQAKVPYGLLLWKDQPPITRSELLFGLRLTRDEIADGVQHGDTLLVSTPLPISRLTEIAVPANSPEEVTKYMRGWIMPDVPVPSPLFTQAAAVVPTSVTSDFQVPTPQHTPNTATDETPKAIMHYDRMMGLFAFMRNAARHHSGRLGVYADYPSQFFHLMSRIRSGLAIANAPSVPPSPFLQSILAGVPPADAAQAGLYELLCTAEVYVDKPHARAVADAVETDANRDANIHQAFELLFDEDYRAAIRLLQKEPISEISVLLAALYKFSDRQSNDHRNLKQTLHEDWTNVPVVATVLGMLGAYYGYTALDARESRLYAVDRHLAASLEHRPAIKFHLENRFERELIETIYQHCFYHEDVDAKTAALFDSMHPKPDIRPSSPRLGYWKDDSYQVADIWVRVYRMTTLGRCLQRIEGLPASSIDETSVLGQFLMSACFFHADEFEISRRNGKNAFLYRISKQRLIELLSEEKVRVNLKMLATALDEDVPVRK